MHPNGAGDASGVTTMAPVVVEEVVLALSGSSVWSRTAVPFPHHRSLPASGLSLGVPLNASPLSPPPSDGVASACARRKRAEVQRIVETADGEPVEWCVTFRKIWGDSPWPVNTGTPIWSVGPRPASYLTLGLAKSSGTANAHATVCRSVGVERTVDGPAIASVKPRSLAPRTGSAIPKRSAVECFTERAS
jgi:hypothetical protein